MSKGLKDLIWHYHYEGYSNDKIAELLDITVWEVVKVLRPNGY